MKEIIIQKLKTQIDALQNAQADSFIASNLPQNPTITDVQNLLLDITEGTTQTP